MFEGLRLSAHSIKELALGHQAIESVMTVTQSSVVGDRYHLEPTTDMPDLMYAATLRTETVTEIPYRRLGPITLPFLNHNEAVVIYDQAQADLAG